MSNKIKALILNRLSYSTLRLLRCECLKWPIRRSRLKQDILIIPIYGRYTITKEEEMLAVCFHIEVPRGSMLHPSYNASPSQDLPSYGLITKGWVANGSTIILLPATLSQPDPGPASSAGSSPGPLAAPPSFFVSSIRFIMAW
jgi:hypothetical protein